MLAFDESITLKHNIRTQRQMQQEKKKQDPITWQIEFLNLRIRNNASAFFTYSMLMDNQTLRQVFYPRDHKDVKFKKRNKYAIPKQEGEVRAISCDIAFVEGKHVCNLLKKSSVYVIKSCGDVLVYRTFGDAEFFCRHSDCCARFHDISAQQYCSFLR
jgi:hypothetical protein